jgi:hypothetical protein
LDFDALFFADLDVAGELLELLDAGQLVDVFEAEAEQKLACSFVEDRAADDLLASSGGDELAADQAAEYTTRVDASNLATSGAVTGCL